MFQFISSRYKKTMPLIQSYFTLSLLLTFLIALASCVAPKGSDEVIDAVRRGNYEEVARLLDEGYSAKSFRLTAGGYSLTALDAAVSRNDTALTRLLMEHGANPLRRVTKKDNNALRSVRSVEMVALIQEYGDYFKEENLDLRAVIRDLGRTEEGIRLIESIGIDLNSRTFDNSTLLINAAGWSAVHLVEELLSFDVNLDLLDDSGYTAIIYSVHRASPQRPDSLRVKSMKVCSLLIDAGADLSITDTTGKSLLTYIRSGDEQLFEYLVESGADIHALDSSGNTVLHHLLRGESHLYTVDRLIPYFVEAGFDLTQLNHSGESLLDVCLTVPSTRALLEAGVDMNRKDSLGETVIEREFKKGSFSEKTIYLLHAGLENPYEETFDVNVMSSNYTVGRTFLRDIWVKKDLYTDSMVADLSTMFNALSEEEKSEQVYRISPDRNFISAVQAMHRRGIDPAYFDPISFGGSHPLVRAVQLNKEEFVKLYFDLGFNPKRRASGGATLLHYLSGYHDEDVPVMTQLLIAYGVDVNGRDENGRTPLMKVAGRRYLESTRLLLNAGANKYAVDNDGKTVMDYLAEFDYRLEEWEVKEFSELLE